ncbi:MAG: acetyl-CoA C-acyltransferase [Blastocatellia bacterium AA13]|nr:MAG: acetyl-CoA C-acyltransferase [Blastocatellia bacterium AA13]
MSKAVILSGVRTPIGSFGGSLKDVSAVELGRIAIDAAIERAGVDPGDIDEVIMGNVLQAGLGMNPARQAAVSAGIPDSVPSFTVNKVCGSGLKAVALAAQAISAGDADLIVAGGTESMSRAPYILTDARWGYRMGNGELKDSMLSEGLTCALAGCHMGVTAENIAAKYEIAREAQDQFAVESQRRASEAIAAGRFTEEIVPVPVPQKKGEPLRFKIDEHPRADTSAEKLARLRPAFQSGEGSVTAGNSSGINDGAAALVIASAERARLMETAPLARIVAYASAGVDPRFMGMGPVPAIQRVLEKSSLEINEIDLFELNEAFASQSLAVVKELGLDASKVNVNGGALALGHPIGASGARVLVTLLYEMKRRDLKRGLASLCIGGGQGIAMIVER